MKIKSQVLTNEQKRVRNSLVEQLKLKRQATPYYLDLVNDYITMMRIRDRLQKDIDEKGTLVEYNNGGGQRGYKKNDSVDQFNKICDRMIKQLDFLGIKPSETILEEDEDDEL